MKKIKKEDPLNTVLMILKETAEKYRILSEEEEKIWSQKKTI